jgi:hypothetical protein
MIASSDGRKAGLPDGLFSNQKSKFWVNFGGSCNGRCWYILRTLGPSYGLLLDFMDIWYTSWKFGIFLSRFGIFVPKKSGNPV